MNDGKKIRRLGLVLLGIVLLIFFGSMLKSPSSDIPKVIIVQDKPQEWADALKMGFIDGLEEKGYKDGENVIIVAKSAAGDPQGLTGLAEAIKKQESLVIYTLGTQATQAVYNRSKGKNIVFGAVTDPVKAGFYDEDLEHPIGNITGTQDLWPYPAQFDMMISLIPNLKKIGVIYNASEINSQVSISHIKHQAKKRGIDVIENTITDESQVIAATTALLNDNIDLFFIPADNTAQTSSGVIIRLCKRGNIPVFTGIPGIVESGALGTVGTNYYDLGKVNARQVTEIIEGKKSAHIPVAIADKGDIYLNLKVADDLNLNVPQSMVKNSFKIYR